MVTATKKGTVPIFVVWVLLVLATVLLPPTTASAGKPEVRWVELNREARHWRITVTLSHNDAGDYHFLERWQVRTPDRRVLGDERFHTPRVQAAERISTLRDVRVPRDVDTLYVRARDSLHGWGPNVEIDLTEGRGDRYRIRTETDW
jgi:hypothetical protein